MNNLIFLFALSFSLQCNASSDTQIKPPKIADRKPNQHSVKSTNIEKITEGTFLGTEQGDYMHIQIKDNKGTEYSFWCLDQACDPLGPDDGSKKHKMFGKKVKIHWIQTKKFLQSAGEEIDLELVTKIEILN